MLEAADLVGPLTTRRVNYILIDVIYSKFEVIDFSVISNRKKVDWSPCIKTGQWTYNELKEIKDYKSPINRDIERQAEKHTDNLSYLKSMELGIAKTFNIRNLYTFLLLLNF